MTTMSLDPALRSRIESLLQANRVVLFMKGEASMPQCGFSAKAVGALNALGVEFAHVNVLADAQIREGIKLYGDWPTSPQLYVEGELIGGSDIIEQMLNSGELSQLLGAPPIDRTPPQITITAAAAEMLRGALQDAGDGAALVLAIDAQFQPGFQIGRFDANAIAAESGGVRVQFDAASARRAEGVSIDWVDDIRGKGLFIDNPNAPKAVQQISPKDAAAKIAAGELLMVDVRPQDERDKASVKLSFKTFDGNGRAELEALPKDTAIAFMCYRGGRSQAAADAFVASGFRNVFNITGGITAWADEVDASVGKY
jgi:monothiol glutaredoxin